MCPITKSYIATGILMLQDTVQYSAVLVLMNHLHVYSDLWQTVLSCKVTVSHIPSLLLMVAHEGHVLQVGTAWKRTLAVNNGVGCWLTALWEMVKLSNRKTNSSLWDVRNCAYRMVVLDSEHPSLPLFRSRSSAKQSHIPRPTRNRTQSSSPAKDASKPVIAASVRRSRSNSNLQHAGTPMTPKCWLASSYQTVQSSR